MKLIENGLLTKKMLINKKLFVREYLNNSDGKVYQEINQEDVFAENKNDILKDNFKRIFEKHNLSDEVCSEILKALREFGANIPETRDDLLNNKTNESDCNEGNSTPVVVTIPSNSNQIKLFPVTNPAKLKELKAIKCVMINKPPRNKSPPPIETVPVDPVPDPREEINFDMMHSEY